MHIDLYELKAECAERCGNEVVSWVMDNGAAKTAYVVTVDEDMPKELADALIQHGYENGDSVLVVVQ